MEFSTAASISVKKNLKGTHLWARCPLWTSVTQVVPVSVVATQLLLRVLEISKLPSSVLERAGGCLGYVFRVVLSSILRLPLDFLEV